MTSNCFIFSDDIKKPSIITPSNIKSVLDYYYSSQKLDKINDSFWSNSQLFNQENYMMCALMINITYLCCGGAKYTQICENNDINKLLDSIGVKNANRALSTFSTAFGYGGEDKAWFATMGIIGPNLGVISWRGTQTETEWVANFSPGFYQSSFKTCNEPLTYNNDKTCNLSSLPFFQEYDGLDDPPKVHSKMLDIYNDSVITTADGVKYSIYGAIKNLYPPETQWIITGHSLGAALAELCAADLSSRGVKINSVYLFASPSPGNDIYLNIYNKLPDNNSNGKNMHDITYNIKNIDDIVPNSLKYYDFGRQLIGTVKKFDGPGGKITSPSIAHNMCISYIISGINKLFPTPSNNIPRSGNIQLPPITQFSDKLLEQVKKHYFLILMIIIITIIFITLLLIILKNFRKV